MTRSPIRLCFTTLLAFLSLGAAVSRHGLAQNADEKMPAADGLRPTVPARPSQAELRKLYRPEVFRTADGFELPYRLMAPSGLQSPVTGSDSPAAEAADSDRKYPLVLFLHGAGERGTDNVKQLVHGAAEFARADRRENQQAFVVFPQCPVEKQWVETPWGESEGSGSFPEKPSAPMDAVFQLVETLLETLPIDRTRIYVTGLSMGGYGTWYAAGSRPDWFAAAVAVCGGGDPLWASRYSGLPIWSVHGGNDRVVPTDRGREIVAALVTAGHDGELHYSEYSGVGHNSWSRTYARDDIHQWMFRQRRGKASSEP